MGQKIPFKYSDGLLDIFPSFLWIYQIDSAGVHMFEIWYIRIIGILPFAVWVAPGEPPVATRCNDIPVKIPHRFRHKFRCDVVHLIALWVSVPRFCRGIKQGKPRKKIVVYFNPKPHLQAVVLKFCTLYDIIQARPSGVAVVEFLVLRGLIRIIMCVLLQFQAIFFCNGRHLPFKVLEYQLNESQLGGFHVFLQLQSSLEELWRG